ncbi:cell adhesion molecule 1-like [Liolophura sinensis]|uniref:cell adhesion molecule 1-like n=1 Tax=Liolophura sinensis TaxID=3198878 RepID=UPI0031588D81
MVTRVTLRNPPDAVLAGDPITFTCITPASKPQACIRGYIRNPGNVRELDPGDCNQDSPVQTTARRFTFTASAEENGAELYCNASNSVTDPPVRSQVYTLSVLYPPQNGVRLTGYVNNTAVVSGETLTLTCQVGQGNPQPALSWSSECGQTKTVPGNDGSQQISISISVSPSLNQKTCVCEGSQDGALTGWTERKNRTFTVLFGPDSVQLRADSGQSGTTVTVTENSTVTFTCNTNESNPAAVHSWFNSGSPVAAAEISKVSSQRGPNHGYLTTQQYTVRVDRYQDGDVIRCEAQRPGHIKRVSQSLTLDVNYAPQVLCNTSHVTVFEGQRVKISCDVISKLEVSVLWVKDGRQIDDASITNYRGPNQRDVTVATIEFGQADKSLSGIYQIEARNSLGSFRMEVSVTVIDGQYIPSEMETKSCSNNQATLVWASGIDDSLVEYYKLEYRATEGHWKEELVRNPGRIKLVRKTLRDLEPGVFYQFRLQPVSYIVLMEYATANCTIYISGSQTPGGLSNTPETGISKAAMFGVGIVVGIALITLAVVMVTCWLLRRGRLTWHKELQPSDKENTDHDLSLQSVDDREQPEPPPLGKVVIVWQMVLQIMYQVALQIVYQIV